VKLLGLVARACAGWRWVLGSLVAHGKLGSHKPLIDKPVAY
jgi:hypothetical protein